MRRAVADVRSRCASATLLFVAAAFVSACTPDLAEGTYACGGDGSCPPGWFCRGDDLCYRTPDPDGSTGGLALYEPCTDAAQCESGVCDKGPDPNATTGQCSQSCGTCPVVGTQTGICVQGFCIAGCANQSDCDPAFGCFGAPGFMGKGCFEVVSPLYDATHACDGGSLACQAPILCARDATHDTLGVCGWPCGMAAFDDCPLGSVCTMLPGALNATMTDAVCLAPCVGNPECHDGLVCAAFPSTQKHCVPSGWIGL